MKEAITDGNLLFSVSSRLHCWSFLFLLHINNPGAICNSSFFNDDATTNSECDWTSVRWQQIKLFLNLFINKLHKTIIHKAMYIGLISDYIVSVGDNSTAFI